MLSYMRQDGVPAAGGNDSSGQTSQRKDVDQGEIQSDYLVPAQRGKSVKRGTMVLAILFGAGVLCLFFMIKKTVPDSAGAAVVDDQQIRIDEAIAQLSGIRTTMDDQMDMVVGKFYYFSDAEQVEVEQLKKNPFKHEFSIAGLENQAGDEKISSSLGQILAAEGIKKRSEQLQLQSIMESSKSNCCMIDEKILYEGDSIAGFVVSRIEGDFVELSLDGVNVILKIAQ